MHGRANLSRNIENLVVVAVSIFQDKETAMSHYKQGQQLFYSLFHSKGPYVSLAWLCWANQTRNIRVWKFDCQHIGGNKIQLWNRGSCISGWSEVQSVPDRCDPVRPVTYRSQESDTVCPTHVSLTTFSPSLIQFNTFCFPNFWYFFVWRGARAMILTSTNTVSLLWDFFTKIYSWTWWLTWRWAKWPTSSKLCEFILYSLTMFSEPCNSDILLKGLVVDVMLVGLAYKWVGRDIRYPK